MVFALIGTANTALWDRGSGLIYDDDLIITWVRDAGMGGQRTWSDAMEWVGNLVYGDYDDWRLPATPGTTYEGLQVKARWDTWALRI